MKFKVKLFICHASEDKDFVRPLVETLKQDFHIWYDEYELTMGDSLLRKINDGLKYCDFGIVVLSQAFFQKNWPRRELEALFELEQTMKKILPIWKDMTAQEIRNFYPLLAGRLAVDAAKGIDYIVCEIKRAVISRIKDAASLAEERLAGMNSRLQKAINAGATEFNFDVELQALEDLYEAIKSNPDLEALMSQLQNRYNQHLSNIRLAIARKITLSKVNKYFEKELIGWYRSVLLTHIQELKL